MISETWLTQLRNWTSQSKTRDYKVKRSTAYNSDQKVSGNAKNDWESN